jgi:hypothetical protein
MITEIAPEYWIVKPSDLEDVERYLERLEELQRRAAGTAAAPAPVRIGHAKFRPWQALGAALATLTLVMALEQTLSATETAVETWEPKRKRRRRRTELCLRICLGIVAIAQEFTNSRWYAKRGIWTIDKEPRTSRRFRSRA